MMKYLMFVTLLLLGSCSREIEYQVDPNEQVIVRPTEIEIDEYREISWKVGHRRKQEISQGVSVIFNLPLFKKEDLMDLVFKREVDSWLIRVRKRTMATSKVLERLFLPFVQQGGISGQGKMYVSQKGSVTLFLYYKAAAKERWANRPCPPFRHNLKIEEIKIKKSPHSDRLLLLNTPQKKNFIDEIKPYDFNRKAISVGDLMVGEYQLEIALFNSNKRERKSDFFSVGDTLAITKEKAVHINGCEDYVPKDTQEEESVLEKFKFGR